MADVKYLVTVNSETCMITKLEKMGKSGEATTIDLNKLAWDFSGFGNAAIVVNIYGGGAAAAQNCLVKVTDRDDDLCICFPCNPPSARAR